MKVSLFTKYVSFCCLSALPITTQYLLLHHCFYLMCCLKFTAIQDYHCRHYLEGRLTRNDEIKHGEDQKVHEGMREVMMVETKWSLLIISFYFNFGEAAVRRSKKAFLVLAIMRVKIFVAFLPFMNTCPHLNHLHLHHRFLHCLHSSSCDGFPFHTQASPSHHLPPISSSFLPMLLIAI